jgi:hypothetical protein
MLQTAPTLSLTFSVLSIKKEARKLIFCDVPEEFNVRLKS